MNHSLRVGLVILFAACTGAADITSTTITGTNAFAIQSSLMVPEALHCTTGQLASGKLDALSVVIADVDLSSMGCYGGEYDMLPHGLQLEVATGGYFTAAPDSANEPIVAGTTFSILNETVSDEDLCGNVPPGTTRPTAIAILNICPSGCTHYFASSGTITVASVSPTSVTGSYDLMLTNDDAEPQGTLSGTFDSSTCP